MSDILGDTSKPWALINFHDGDNNNNNDIGDSNSDPGDSYDGTRFHDDDSSLSEGKQSTSISVTDHGEASTDATPCDIADVGIDDKNVNNGVETAEQSAIEFSHYVLSFLATPPYPQELHLGDEDEDVSVSTSSDTEVKDIGTDEAHATCDTESNESSELRVGREGEIRIWRRGTELTYCICHDTFPTKDLALSVESALPKAIASWGGIGPRFRQVEPHEAVTFIVIYDNTLRRGTYARSFFPGDMLGILRVCPISFSTGNDKHLANILAHEVGHIVGLRHEFKEPGSPSVLFGSENPQSIMNYYDDLNDLQVTERDIEELRDLYAYKKRKYKGLPIVRISSQTYIRRNGSNNTTPTTET